MDQIIDHLLKDPFILVLVLSAPLILAVHLWVAFRAWKRQSFAVAWRKEMWRSFIFALLYAVPSGLLTILYWLDSEPPEWAFGLVLVVGFPFALAMGLTGELGPVSCALAPVLTVAIFFALALCMRLPLLFKPKMNSSS